MNHCPRSCYRPPGTQWDMECVHIPSAIPRFPEPSLISHLWNSSFLFSYLQPLGLRDALGPSFSHAVVLISAVLREAVVWGGEYTGLLEASIA